MTIPPISGERGFEDLFYAATGELPQQQVERYTQRGCPGDPCTCDGVELWQECVYA